MAEITAFPAPIHRYGTGAHLVHYVPDDGVEVPLGVVFASGEYYPKSLKIVAYGLLGNKPGIKITEKAAEQLGLAQSPISSLITV